MNSPDETVQLLDRWYDGNQDALAELLDRNIGWMRVQVRKHLSPAMRKKFDSMDLVQEGAVRLLKYGPRFAPKNQAQFRSLLSQMILNLVRDRYDALKAGRRNVSREEQLPSQGLSRVKDLRKTITLPPQAAERREIQEWIRLGLELVDPEDRQVIYLRQYEELPFDEIAKRLELANSDAARMRFNRALPKLARKIRELQEVAQQPWPDSDGK